MKTVLVIGCFLILSAVPLAMAQDGPKLGVGVFAGLSTPVLQDDQSQGMEYGFKGRYGLGSLFVLEP